MLKQSIICLTLVLCSRTLWAFSWFGESLCSNPKYTCRTIKRGETWTQLFPNPVERDMVKRVNRLNVFLQMDMVIAVPKNVSKITLLDVSPLPKQIQSYGEKRVQVDLSHMAWGAYDGDGQLLKWGPISSGTQTCSGDSKGCATPTGFFRVFRKSGPDCVSQSFPKGVDGTKGGGEMPFCMFFYRGYALHGSTELPGYPASYGCVRLFIDDARWLNTEFVEIPAKGRKGTEIVIQ